MKHKQAPTATNPEGVWFFVGFKYNFYENCYLKAGKAAGPDGIQAWILRDLAPLLAPPITAIFNSSLREGYVPEKMEACNSYTITKEVTPNNPRKGYTTNIPYVPGPKRARANCD